VPCGISDAGVTSLSAEAGYPVTVAAALPVMEGHLADVLGHERTTVTEDIEALTGSALSGSALLATGR
jgi:hypothetical protein